MRPAKWQRNAIYDAVVAGGLDAAECNFDYDADEWRIGHVLSESYFLIQNDSVLYNTTAVVGDNPSLGQLPSAIWSTVIGRIQRWAGEARRDIDTPDLWAELRRTQSILIRAGYEDVENTPFNPGEQAEIHEKLREIKELLEGSGSLSAEQELSVKAKFDVLATAATQAGRRDWQLMFGGVILGLILEQVLPNDLVWDILRQVGDGLGHLLSGAV